MTPGECAQRAANHVNEAVALLNKGKDWTLHSGQKGTLAAAATAHATLALYFQREAER